PEDRYQTISEFRKEYLDGVGKQLNNDTKEKYIPKTTLVEKKDALELAVTNCKLGKYKLAEKILQTEIVNGNVSSDLVLQLAFVYFKTGRRFDALKTVRNIDISEVEEARKENLMITIQELKARILFSLKKYEEALDIYRDIVKQKPNS